MQQIQQIIFTRHSESRKNFYKVSFTPTTITMHSISIAQVQRMNCGRHLWNLQFRCCTMQFWITETDGWTAIGFLLQNFDFIMCHVSNEPKDTLKYDLSGQGIQPDMHLLRFDWNCILKIEWLYASTHQSRVNFHPCLYRLIFSDSNNNHLKLNISKTKDCSGQQYLKYGCCCKKAQNGSNLKYGGLTNIFNMVAWKRCTIASSVSALCWITARIFIFFAEYYVTVKLSLIFWI